MSHKGARRALVAEMAQNLATLQVLVGQSSEGSPIVNMLSNLRLNRYALDAHLPLLATATNLSTVRTILATYAGPSNLLATLEGKWVAQAGANVAPYRAGYAAASEQDKKALAFAEQEFRRGLFDVAKAVLTPDELLEAGLAS